MMQHEKVRELTIDGFGPYRVGNRSGILGPGKFEGEMPHAVRDYGIPADDSAGDVSEYGIYAWRVGHRFYETGEQGFVTEIDHDGFEAIAEGYAQSCELAETLEEEEQGSCDSCQALMINGVRCHKTGCPRAWLLDLRRRVDAIRES